MSEEQRNEENEVEAHHRGRNYDANQEPRDEAETDDEVEAHHKQRYSKPRHMD
jgi:hypothetical protein